MLKRLLVKDMGFDDPETKKEVFVNKMELKNGIFEILETRFSGQNLMTRVFTFVLIFKTNFLKKTFKKKEAESRYPTGSSKHFLNNLNNLTDSRRAIWTAVVFFQHCYIVTLRVKMASLPNYRPQKS